MKKLPFYILCFVTGFFGTALLVDQNNKVLLYAKAMFSCLLLLSYY